MRAREALLTRPDPRRPRRLFPICTPDGSDSASFDEVLELLHLGGRSLPHAVLMMIPEAWENHAEMDAGAPRVLPLPLLAHGALGRPGLRLLHRRHQIGAVLDRNGLRPGRYWVTDDGLVVFASEAGVLPTSTRSVVRKGRLQPGRMFLVDTGRSTARSTTTRSRRAGRRAPVRRVARRGV
jgi:glutamate synthase (NADPH/NADH) large chain